MKKKLLFIAWDFDFSKSAALVGGMVKNPYYLYKGIGGKFDKSFLTTSKNKDFFRGKEKERVNTNYLAALPKYFLRCLIISMKVRKEKDLDIIHVHTPALAPIFFKKKHTPMVITAHGTHWPEFKANHKIKGFKSLVIYINAYLQFSLEKKIYKMADKVISVSDFQVKELVEDYGVPESKIAVIQNGIDFDTYRKPDPASERNTDVLFVGRPVPKKGIDILLNAIDIVNAQIGSPLKSDWVFGQGWVSEPNVTKNYETKIKALGGEIHNHVPEEDLPSFYANSKIIVVPSLGYESLPTVLMEGLASGVVPLASKSFGNVELLPDELLFKEGNVEELANKISDVVRNQENYKKMADQVNLEKYSLKYCVEAHEELYLRVCNEK